jgi:hypothetical protein
VLVHWADAIADRLPGFPAGAALLHDDALLLEVLTTVIFRSSVMHGMDHGWARDYMGTLCVRPRVPPPSRHVPSFFPPPRAWLLVDAWMTYVMNYLFINPTLGPVAQNLRDVDYSGLERALGPKTGVAEACAAFRDDLRRTEAQLVKLYGKDAALDDVTCSMWY